MTNYQNLVGRPFQWGSLDCYGLVRDFYSQIFGIELPDYARPDDFWSKGLDLFQDHYLDAGFYALERVHPSQWQFGDVIISAIQSRFGNHSAILVENGKILHHLYGRISTVEPYKGLVRNGTTGVFRHRDVKLPQLQSEQRDIREFLSPSMRNKLDALRQTDPEAS